MTTLILTVAGDDRAGLVAELSSAIAAGHGNWERSQLAELAGTFAGVVEVSVPDPAADDLRRALSALDGTLSVAVRVGSDDDAPTGDELVISVLGNDRPGIVRELSAVLEQHGVSIENLETEVRDAALFGGRLFEATMTAIAPADLDLDAVQDGLEAVAGEIQVDLTVAAAAR